MTELYEKAVEGQWYDPRTRRTVQVFAITYEVTQRPSRKKTLIMEILADFPDAGNFEYSDDLKLEYEGGMPVYPQIQVGSTTKREIINP